MSDLFFALIERREFGDILAGGGLERARFKPARGLNQILTEPIPFNDSLVAVWAQDPRNAGVLPCLLICEDSAVSDWTAWITTYLARLRPFTAFMRLLGRSEFESIIENYRSPDLNGILWPITGLIIGEVLAAAKLSDRSLETLPLNAFESTLSFALFRALAVNLNVRNWGKVTDAWEFARRATKQTQRAIEANEVVRVCAILVDASGIRNADLALRPTDREVSSACREVLQTRSPVPNFLRDSLPIGDVQRITGGAREERVLAFAEFIRSLPTRPEPGDELIPFAVGYLASRIAPGTIQHASVLESAVRAFPTATLWYGLCAGASAYREESRAGHRIGLELPPVARWIARDLTREDSLLKTPMSDIGIQELVALSRSERDPLMSIVRASQSTATVELAPSVWTVVNVHPKGDIGEASRERREIKNRDALSRLGEQLRRLNLAFDELMEDNLDQPTQRSLFSTKRKK